MNKKEQCIILANFFEKSSQKTIEDFLSICTYKKVKNRGKVIDEHPTKRLFFFILKGVVRGYHLSLEGEERNVFIKPEGTFVGPPDMLFEYKPSLYSFESILESEVLIFDLQEFESLILSNSELTKIYFNGLKEHIITLIDRVESLTEKAPEQRYLDLIEKHPLFFKKAFNKHIASFLGITPVSLSRIIKRIRDAK